MPKHHATKQHLHIPFTVPNRCPCTVDITIEPDSDPIKAGKGLLDLWPDPAVVAGYPVLQAVVSSPESRIYASLYGWVQITNTPGEDWVMDLYPQFQDVNSPFAMWGAEPTFVDAPGQVARKNYDWTARAFLCYSPDAAMTKTVVPVLGVEWGYWVEDGKPFVKELERLDVAKWNEHLELFKGQFRGWTFKEV